MINPEDIKKSRLYSALVLESVFARGIRHKIKRIIGIVISIFVIVVAVTLALKWLNLLPENLAKLVAVLSPKITGLILILFAIWFIVFLLEGFFRSKYFKEREISRKDENVVSDEKKYLSLWM